MRVLIACEFSGIVRNAFIRAGHDAFSCDLTEGTRPTYGRHIKCDVLEILNDNWDLMIAHPPCHHLAVSGARLFHKKVEEQYLAVEFFCKLLDAPINKIAVENPIGVMNRYKKPTQIIQPYMFGDRVRKSTCLWLKNLPKLKPTNIVDPTILTHPSGQSYSLLTTHGKSYSRGRSRRQARSVFFEGVAEAMANQWGSL